MYSFLLDQNTFLPQTRELFLGQRGPDTWFVLCGVEGGIPDSTGQGHICSCEWSLASCGQLQPLPALQDEHVGLHVA